MLDAHLDESSDKHKTTVLCVGGIVAAPPLLQSIQTAWIDRLEDENIRYFRFSDCRGMHGQFFQFRQKYGDRARERAEAVLHDLETILLSTSWIGFGLGVVIQEYMEVLREFPTLSSIYREDPTEAAYGQMMYEIARTVRKQAPGLRVAYLIDESNDYPKIAGVFRATKQNHPIIGRTMTTVAPLNDEITPALQMGDLIVGKIREAFAAWISDSSRTLNETWSDEWNSHIEDVGIWNRAHMLRSVRATITKVSNGKVVMREVPKPSGSELRKQEKARRKRLRAGKL